MLSFENLKNSRKSSTIAPTYIKHPSTKQEMTLLELALSLEPDYFKEYAQKELKSKGSYMNFVCYDGETLFCVKKLTKLEALLLAEIINTNPGKIEAIQDVIYFSDYSNETSYADSIHQLLVIQTLKRANYTLAMNEAEIDEDNRIFAD